VPTKPCGSGDVVVICSTPAIVSEKGPEAVCCGVLESFTVMVALVVPAADGVPPITPVEGLIDKPVGRPVADHVKGVVPPTAVTVAL
jgi:hypothetical protein